MLYEVITPASANRSLFQKRARVRPAVGTAQYLPWNLSLATIGENSASIAAGENTSSGMDVTYEGIRMTPEQIVASAIDEDAHRNNFV